MVQPSQRICRWIVVLAGLAVLVACGGTPPPPKRGVLENNVSSWKFRRYQELLDVEVWVDKNKAVAHTASYVRGKAEKEGRLDAGDIVNVFVTRYENDLGVLRATVKFVRRLAQEAGYQVEEDKVGGVRLFSISRNDERWMIWAAKRHVVKVGGQDVGKVPKALVKAYGKRYPSRIKGGMLEGPLPEEPALPADDKDGDDGDDGDKEEPYNPDNPTPDWDKYEPGELKTPKKKSDEDDS